MVLWVGRSGCVYPCEFMCLVGKFLGKVFLGRCGELGIDLISNCRLLESSKCLLVIIEPKLCEWTEAFPKSLTKRL